MLHLNDSVLPLSETPQRGEKMNVGAFHKLPLRLSKLLLGLAPLYQRRSCTRTQTFDRFHLGGDDQIKLKLGLTVGCVRSDLQPSLSQLISQ